MYRTLFLTSLLSLASFAVAAEPSVAADPSASQTDAPSQDSSGNAAAKSETPFSRWFQLDAASFSLRDRKSFDTDGVKIFDDIQQRSLLAGKFKLDKEGKYFIGFRASSGRYFNWGYSNISGLDSGAADTSATTHMPLQRQYLAYYTYFTDPDGILSATHEQARGWQFYLRDLYASATPIKGLTFEFGGIPIERGVGSEITTYDEDGYISGERVRVKQPDHFYLDQIEFTSAYFGDIYFPNFFDRADRLSQSNYRQILGEKHFGSRLKASADYTWLAGTNTVREAALVNIKESRVLDSARVELYQRLNNAKLNGFLAPSANGWAFTGAKHLTKKILVDGGYDSVDQDYGIYSGSSTATAFGFAMNGDSYQVGKRFFAHANVTVAPGVSLFGFFTHQIDAKASPLTFAFTRQNMNFGVQFDFKSMLEHAHIL